VSEASGMADSMIQERLVSLAETISVFEPEVSTGVKTFVNQDGWVDGELRVTELPDRWRRVSGLLTMITVLSEVFRAWRVFPKDPEFGGKFWISFGVRLGPKDFSEIEDMAARYKRHRGLCQIGTYFGGAWAPGLVQANLAVGFRTAVEGFEDKYGYPPREILVRVVWSADGTRPGRYEGER